MAHRRERVEQIGVQQWMNALQHIDTYAFTPPCVSPATISF